MENTNEKTLFLIKQLLANTLSEKDKSLQETTKENVLDAQSESLKSLLEELQKPKLNKVVVSKTDTLIQSINNELTEREGEISTLKEKIVELSNYKLESEKLKSTFKQIEQSASVLSLKYEKETLEKNTYIKALEDELNTLKVKNTEMFIEGEIKRKSFEDAINIMQNKNSENNKDVEKKQRTLEDAFNRLISKNEELEKRANAAEDQKNHLQIVNVKIIEDQNIKIKAIETNFEEKINLLKKENQNLQDLHSEKIKDYENKMNTSFLESKYSKDENCQTIKMLENVIEKKADEHILNLKEKENIILKLNLIIEENKNEFNSLLEARTKILEEKNLQIFSFQNEIKTLNFQKDSVIFDLNSKIEYLQNELEFLLRENANLTKKAIKNENSDFNVTASLKGRNVTVIDDNNLLQKKNEEIKNLKIKLYELDILLENEKNKVKEFISDKLTSQQKEFSKLNNVDFISKNYNNFNESNFNNEKLILKVKELEALLDNERQINKEYKLNYNNKNVENYKQANRQGDKGMKRIDTNSEFNFYKVNDLSKIPMVIDSSRAEVDSLHNVDFTKSPIIYNNNNNYDDVTTFTNVQNIHKDLLQDENNIINKFIIGSKLETESEGTSYNYNNNLLNSPKEKKITLGDDLDKSPNLSPIKMRNTLPLKEHNFLEPTNPDKEKNYYDLIINIDSLKSLKEGWKVNFFNSNSVSSYELRRIKPSLVVSVTGNKSKGKSYILNRIFNNISLPNGFSVATTGFSIKYTNIGNKNFSLIDTSGFENPIKHVSVINNLNVNLNNFKLEGNKNEERLFSEAYNEKVNSDLFMQRAISEASNIILFVVDQLSYTEQKLINRFAKLAKNKLLIIVHNLMHFIHTNQVVDHFKTILKRAIRFKEATYGGTDSNDIKQTNQKYWLDTSSNAIHVIMAHEGSEAGNYFNETSLKFLKDKILNYQSNNTFDPISSLATTIVESSQSLLAPHCQITSESLKYGKDTIFILTDKKLELAKIVVDDAVVNLIKGKGYGNFTVLKIEDDLMIKVEISNLNKEALVILPLEIKDSLGYFRLKAGKNKDKEMKTEGRTILKNTRDDKDFNLEIPFVISDFMLSDRNHYLVSYENGVLTVYYKLLKQQVKGPKIYGF